MRKNKQQLPIRRHLFYLAAFLLGIIILNSCTKINTDKLQSDIPINKIDISEKFFYSSQKTDATVKRVLENLKQRNDKYEFVENFVMENGYPIWNKAVISTKTRSYNSVTNSVNGQTDTIIQIPLVLPNTNKVNGFIAAVINDSINYNLYIGKDYYKYSFNDVPEDSLNADKAAMQIMLLDKAVFGYTDFAINDNRLFSNQSNYNINAPQRIIKISNNNGNSGNIVPVCESVIIDWVVIECTFYQCTVTWINTIIICPNYGGGPSGGGTTGGGSPFPPPPPGGTGVPCYGCGTGGTGSSGSPNGTGGGGLGWTPVPIPSNVLWLKNTLNLTPNQVDWLIQNPLRVTEIYNYLEEETNVQRIQIAKDHIEKMKTDASYLALVLDHTAIGNPNKMWWEDEVWLKQINFQMPEVAFNFYMKHTKPVNIKPEEFANRCDGLKEIAQRTAADPNQNERLGYITYDGKFIITGIGNGATVNQNLRGRGNTLYYSYPLSLGMPTLNYYGMIIDTANQEIWIPVRASVHTHPDPIFGGVSIDYPNAKSNDDLKSAQETQNISPFFNNFIIEVNGNSFKTGQFDGDKNDMNYFNTHSSLSLTDICQFITP